MSAVPSKADDIETINVAIVRFLDRPDLTDRELALAGELYDVANSLECLQNEGGEA